MRTASIDRGEMHGQLAGKKVGILNPMFWVMGGGQRVAIVTSEAVAESGYEPVLYAERKIDDRMRESMRLLFGRQFGGETKAIPNPPVVPTGTYDILRHRLRSCAFDVDALIDLADSTPMCARYISGRLPDIVYWNAPPPDYAKIKRNAVPSRRGLGASSPYPVLLEYMLRRLLRIKSVFCNSEFSRRKVEAMLGFKLPRVEVLYPPVNIDEWVPRSFVDRKGIVSLSRFSPEKRHDLQLAIAKEVDANLVAMGGARACEETATLRKLRHLAPTNVSLQANLDGVSVKERLWNSKVFLHTADEEPFGMVTVEAISAGMRAYCERHRSRGGDR